MNTYIDIHTRWIGFGIMFDRFKGTKNLHSIYMARLDCLFASLILVLRRGRHGT